MSSTPGSTEPSTPTEPLMRLGVAAMDRKARSRPMRNILSRLLATGKFEITVFDIENWPVCDFLISFYSDGFPIDKAIAYVELRKPVCVNDLPLQKIFWDRRVVLQILDKIGVPTPKRLECNRDGGPQLDKSIADQIQQSLGIRVDKPRPTSEFALLDDDTIEVDGNTMLKPFVEKPVSGENHNINIYFPKRKGGGARRLFRKVGNQSSALEPNMTMPRTDASYIYEQFVDVENAEDIKVYTLGPNFVHAETRKSPVVDGIVRRNTEGKEIRFICQLTDAEKKIARDISIAFKQNICGFDMLRANGKSYVIDVNGCDKCAEILTNFCLRKMPSLPKPVSDNTDKRREKSWTLKSTICVARHGDRTPKCKLKFKFKGKDEWTAPLMGLLQGRSTEIILRDPVQLQYIADAAEQAILIPGADLEQLEQLRKIIEKKKNTIGTKAQLKPSFKEEVCETLAVVVKWGGEMEKVKKKLKTLCRPGLHVRPEFAWPAKEKDPFEVRENRRVSPLSRYLTSLTAQVVKETIELMKSLRETMNENWHSLAVENIQPRWCCGEYPYLFRERWEGLFADWCDVSLEKFDPSRVSELYDSLKYDALHNRVFLETIFTKNGSRPSSIDSRSALEATSSDNGPPRQLRELYKRAKLLFDLIAPQEYGIERSEKEIIGLLTSLPLLEQIVRNLRGTKESEYPSANFYFTKESHIHTLVNLVTLSDLPIVMPHVPELDYMSYISFEVYERSKGDSKELSVRVTLSEGAHSAVLDASLDAKHALQVQPRRALTDYISLDRVIGILERHSKKAETLHLTKSTTKLEGFLPVEGDEVYRGVKSKLEQIREFAVRQPGGSTYSAASDKGE
ncbi:Inositol pyrophosphate synthase [Rhodotorula toruloides ATCC 204091]|uniref:Inositol hexakisphosphate and diphosphoinositol-pentakisphosphate kinase n=1 Tax=Rhodotorula toruloides TaxID=5286 RepID=A0A0K3CNF4_RHOTO|nr:Inositol pyrophosphate synthase [Rhodotorula toruloides ATCC 204091]